MYRFVQALRDRTHDGVQVAVPLGVDVLMVDDVQFIAGKDSTQEEFFHTFNALVEENKQIIISADRAPGEIKGLEERISTRLQSGLVVDLHPTTYELRLGILQTEGRLFPRSSIRGWRSRRACWNSWRTASRPTSACWKARCCGCSPSPRWWGARSRWSWRRTAWPTCCAHSERKVTIEEIQRQVAEHYNIRLSDMIGPKRVRTCARPRQAAMYLCKQLTTRSLPEIGRRFGGRDHTTVMHAISGSRN